MSWRRDPLPIPTEIRARWSDIALAAGRLGGWFEQYTDGIGARDGFPQEPPDVSQDSYLLPHQVKMGERWEAVQTNIIAYTVHSFLIFRVSKSNIWFPQLDLKTLENEVSIADGDGVIQVVLL